MMLYSCGRSEVFRSPKAARISLYFGHRRSSLRTPQSYRRVLSLKGWELIPQSARPTSRQRRRSRISSAENAADSSDTYSTLRIWWFGAIILIKPSLGQILNTITGINWAYTSFSPWRTPGARQSLRLSWSWSRIQLIGHSGCSIGNHPVSS